MKRVCLVLLMGIMMLAGKTTTYATDVPETALQVDSSMIRDVSASKTVKKLKKPMIGSVTATDKATIRLIWVPVKNAQKYEIYRSKYSNKKFKKIGTTKKTQYVDKKGRQLTTYYYKIRAVRKNGKKNIYSKYSITMKKKVRKKVKKTVYAGDSLMVGLTNYGKITDNKKQRVYAKVGITTSKYYNSEQFQKLLEYNPDRLYIMLGVNDIAGNPSQKYMDTTIKYYNKILKKCIKKNPDIEIFVMGVSPVGKGSTVKMKTVNYYNTQLEESVVALENVYYYDLALDMAGDDGYLKPEFVTADSLHWTSLAYDTALKAMRECVKEY